MLNEDELKDALLLILANKQDLPKAATTSQISEELGLHSMRDRSWFIQATCGTTGDGLHDGLEWLCENIKKQK